MLNEKTVKREDRITEIVERVKSLKLVKIILFGSYAWGNVHEDSDIDLIVILNKNGVPKDFKEKTDCYLSVKRLLRDINGEIPMEIIVYTKGQWERFLLLNSYFSKKVVKGGKILYERDN